MDFLIIGAAKAGTTTLFEHLRTHPQIYLPPGKEYPFFATDDRYLRYPGGWPAYSRELFSHAPSDAVLGTATPPYMAGSVRQMPDGSSLADHEHPERIVPSRIRKAMPDVRLIAILRDPVARAYSQHQMETLRHRESRSFDAAVRDLLDSDRLIEARRHPSNTNNYIVWGEYARILGGYFEEFPRKQLLVLFTDELASTPLQVVQSIFEHLGVDTDFVPPNIGTRYLEGTPARRLQWLDVSALVTFASRRRLLRLGWHRLTPQTRVKIIDTVDSVNWRVFSWNREGSKVKPNASSISPETREALRRHFAQDAKTLRQLLGRELPWLRGQA